MRTDDAVDRARRARPRAGRARGERARGVRRGGRAGDRAVEARPGAQADARGMRRRRTAVRCQTALDRRGRALSGKPHRSEALADGGERRGGSPSAAPCDMPCWHGRRERAVGRVVQRRFAGRTRLSCAGDPRARSTCELERRRSCVVASLQDDMDVRGRRNRGWCHRLAALALQGDLRAHAHAALLAAARSLCALGGRRRSPENEAATARARSQALGCSTRRPRGALRTATRAIAAELFDVPVALVSLIDGDRQWFKSRARPRSRPRRRAMSAVLRAHDPRPTRCCRCPTRCRMPASPTTRSSPAIRRVRFDAGAPLAAADGSLLGTLCLIDRRPRQLERQQLEACCAISPTE